MKKAKFVYHFPDHMWQIDFFINPLPALAMITMAINDHWGKYAYPGLLTGKISDFAGMFYFPLLLCALYCLLRNLFSEVRTYINAKMMMVCSLVSIALMLTVKLSSSADRMIEAAFAQFLFPIQLTADPTDLLSFAMIPLSYFYASYFFESYIPEL
jgi:hypothetical protein